MKSCRDSTMRRSVRAEKRNKKEMMSIAQKVGNGSNVRYEKLGEDVLLLTVWNAESASF